MTLNVGEEYQMISDELAPIVAWYSLGALSWHFPRLISLFFPPHYSASSIGRESETERDLYGVVKKNVNRKSQEKIH